MAVEQSLATAARLPRATWKIVGDLKQFPQGLSCFDEHFCMCGLRTTIVIRRWIGVTQ